MIDICVAFYIIFNKILINYTNPFVTYVRMIFAFQ